MRDADTRAIRFGVLGAANIARKAVIPSLLQAVGAELACHLYTDGSTVPHGSDAETPS
jgi:predicted dehydrogenase